MSGFGNLQPRTGNRDSVRLEEVIEMHKWPDNEWSQVRFIPQRIIAVKRHWVKIVAGKDKKEVAVPRYCIAHDPMNEGQSRKDKDGNDIVCPYCSIPHEKDGTRAEFFYLAQAIVREIQEDEPRRKSEPTKTERKTGLKDIRSKSWTPVRVCRITSSLAARMQEIGENNFAKTKKGKVAFDITHEKYGVDIRVKYKSKAAGTDKYSADKDARTPMTDDEKEYLIWKLDDELLDATGRMGVKQAEEDLKRMDLVGGDVPDDDDEGYSLGDDDDDGRPSKKKKKKSKPAFSDDGDDDDDDDDDDDRPSKKSKGKPKKKGKPAFDEEDEDDDDEPVKKKKSSSKSKKSDDKTKKKKAKPAFDDDDDDDDEPKKKKSSGKSKKSDDKPKKKKKSSGKSKKSAWDDDDE